METKADARSSWRVIADGIAINVLNPKLSIFFVAFLPQFIPADEASPLLRMLELSGVFMAMTFGIFAIYGLFAAAMRDAAREISLYQGEVPRASSASLAAHLLGRFTSASLAAVRAEMRMQLEEALNGMEPIDREVIALRHFEELSNDEAAAVLGLTKSAASKRYVRAMLRLKDALAGLPGYSGPVPGVPG